MMKYNPEYHHRRSIRLQGYDYSQTGIYFVTICTYQRQCLFGEIRNGKMILNQIGKIVAYEWLKSAEIRQEIVLDEWVIMPNHLHGIVGIDKKTTIILRIITTRAQIMTRAQALRPYGRINGNRNHCHHLLGVLNLLLPKELSLFVIISILLFGNAIIMKPLSEMKSN